MQKLPSFSNLHEKNHDLYGNAKNVEQTKKVNMLPELARSISNNIVLAESTNSTALIVDNKQKKLRVYMGQQQQRPSKGQPYATTTFNESGASGLKLRQVPLQKNARQNESITERKQAAGSSALGTNKN